MRATPAMRPGTSRLTSLDGLRGLAAAIVVLHHCALTLPSLARQYQGPDRSALGWWATYTPLHLVWAGGEAVLVFFVLSGLVVSRPFLSRQAPGVWWRYYRKRLLRLYVPVVVAVALAACIVHLVPRRPDASWSWWMAEHAVSANLSEIAHDAFLLAGTGWLNSALWSLRYEVFFSLLLPIFVVLARRLTAPLWLSVPLALWGVGWAVSIDHELLSYLFVFTVGVLLAQRLGALAVWGARISTSRRASFLWLLTLTTGALLLLSEWWMQQFVSDWTLWLPVGRPAGVLGAAVLVFVFLHCPAVRRFANSTALQWLGTVSFSLYLVHEPIVVSVAALTPATVQGLLVTASVGSGLSLLVAVLFFHAVERPSRHLAGWAGRLGRPAVPAPATPTQPEPGPRRGGRGSAAMTVIPPAGLRRSGGDGESAPLPSEEMAVSMPKTSSGERDPRSPAAAPAAGPWSDTAVIVRVYNEAPVVGGVISELVTAGLTVIAVDDASTDNSAEEIDKAGAFRVSHPVNLGAGGALQTGFEAALLLTDARYIACFDADGQHQLPDLLGMIEKIREGYDVVMGSRFLEDDGPTQMSWLRRVILRTAARLLNRGAGTRLTDAHNGLRIVARHVAADLQLNHAGMAYASELERHLTQPAYRVTEYPVHILYTDYSKAKGQPLLNSINILAEVTVHRVTGWGAK